MTAPNETMSYPDLELQLWLAKKLPDKISIHPNNSFFWKSEQCGMLGGFVRTREWDYVVRLVEENLSDEEKEYPFDGGYDCYSERQKFMDCLEALVTPETYEEDIYRAMVCAPWQLRTIALSQTLNSPIK